MKRKIITKVFVLIMKKEGKTVFDFSGIMPNPTYAKVQEGAKMAKENNIDLILAVGG